MPFTATPQDNARFPHNLITAKRQVRRGQGTNAPPAPDVTDESAFPDINFASSAAGQGQSKRGNGGGRVGGGGAQEPSLGGGPSVGGGGGEGGGGGGWDGQGRIEEAEIVSGRCVCVCVCLSCVWCCWRLRVM